MNRIAVVHESGTVVNVLVGVLTEQNVSPFTIDQSKRYGNVVLVQVPENQVAYIGGVYTGAQFLPAVEVTENTDDVIAE